MANDLCNFETEEKMKINKKNKLNGENKDKNRT